MELSAQTIDLALDVPFRISRGVQHVAHNVVARLRSAGDDLEGIGEAAPSWYYGERAESVLMAFAHFEGQLGDDPAHIADIMEGLEHVLRGNASAKAAINAALYDLLGQRLGVPVYALLGLNPARSPDSSFTIAIDSPDAMAERARQARDFSVLKIKLGTPQDSAIIRAVRGATDARLRVDANAAWTPKQAVRMIHELSEFDVELVEQPVPAGDLDGLRYVREHVDLPVIADESCVGLDDVARVAPCVDGINIKLAKCGGIGPALAMIHAARAQHLSVMLGCMVESSLGITAAAHLAPLADYVDLDGALLLAQDPFKGAHLGAGGRVELPDRAGLGVRPRATRHEAPQHETRQDAGRATRADVVRDARDSSGGRE